MGTPAPEAERRTTYLELFFDLALVCSITQLVVMLHHAVADPDHALAGRARVGLLAAMIWWLWSQFAWLGTSVRLNTPLPRVLMLGLTGLMLIAAILLPGAFGAGVAGFGIVYALIKVGALVKTPLRGLPARPGREMWV